MTWLTDINADIAAGRLRIVDDWQTPDISAAMQFEEQAKSLAASYGFDFALLEQEADRRLIGSMSTTLARLDAPLFRRAALIASAKRAEAK